MPLSRLAYVVQRVTSRFLDASSFTHLISILSAFIPLRVFLSLKNGMVPTGDGTVETAASLGKVWIGEITFTQFVGPGEAGGFLTHRSSQLFYPLLLSFQKPIGWSIETHLLVLNTVIGSILIGAAYFTGLRLLGKRYAVLVAVLMCSLSPLYWIARWAVVDNLFYAMLAVLALSVVNFLRDRSGKRLALMALAVAGLALTRPESMLVIPSVAAVLAWNVLRHHFSTRAMIGVLALGLTVGAIGAASILRTSPSLQKTLLSKFHVAWGLGLSAHTLFNRGAKEFDQLQNYYSTIQVAGDVTGDDTRYRMSIGALEVIRSNPLWYVLKLPLRGLALLFPWTYQPWSLRHVLYEAVYTIFLTIGVVLLARRGLYTPLAALMAIPLSLLLFLSVYGIDNDLKHRNGIFVGLNLIAPAGYFVTRRSRPEHAAHG